jgi:hypothetical protein
MNYYNEHNPHAAQWLRNLIDAGLIPAGHVDSRDIQEVTKHDLRELSQVLPECNSFGLSVRGMWDRVSKPLQATYNYWSFAMPRFFRAPVYEQYLKRDFHHTTRRLLVHQGCGVGSVVNLNPVVVLPWSSFCRSVPFLDCVHGMFSLILRCWLFGIHQSTAIYCAGLAQWERIYHKPGKHGLLLVRDWGFSSDNAPYIYRNKICGGYATLLNQFHTLCISVLFSYRVCITSYGRCL